MFDPHGEEVLRHRSRDFADRPSDDPLFAAARRLGLPAISLDPAPALAEPVEDDAAFRPDAYGACFRGNRFAARALAGRLTGAEDRVEAKAHETMAVGFLEAWSRRRKSVEETPRRDGRQFLPRRFGSRGRNEA
jgi:hypothetical protein